MSAPGTGETQMVHPCRGGCDKKPERYGPHLDTGDFLYRCRGCNIEWWAAA